MNPSQLTDLTYLTEIETLDTANPIIKTAGYSTVPDWIAFQKSSDERQHIDGALREFEDGDSLEGNGDLADRFTSAHADYAAMLATMIEVRNAMDEHHLTPDLARHLNAAINRATKWNK